MSNPAVPEFRAVDLGNCIAIMELEMVAGQEKFLDSNAFPLAEAAYVEGFTPQAVYLDEELIGLVSWGPYYPDYGYEQPPEAGSNIIDHVMIAAPFQGRGLGRQVVEQLVAKLAGLPECRRIVLVLHPDNTIASKLYRSIGFSQFATTHEGDLVMALDINGPTSVAI
ncbi:MAG: GNAT family N-acetyltransferase [Alphaproteobacteria bacterium]|nr:GNAT family N-acetyltransferase [Alphaproteobacteria bacterium]